MRTLAVLILLLASVSICGVLHINSERSALKEESRRLRKERDMYSSLYRKANTRLMNFQDSINIHCICK